MSKDVLALAGLHFLEAYDKLTDLEQKNYDLFQLLKQHNDMQKSRQKAR